MTTRWDELARSFDRLSAALGMGDRGALERVVERAGWGARLTTEPLLPSGVRHGVPWGLSIAMHPTATELRVWLEAQAEPATEASYRAAGEALLEGIAELAQMRALGTPQRWWHAIQFARDRPPAYHAYACVPDRPQLAWAALDRRGHDGAALRRQLPANAKVTIISTDLRPEGRLKLYALLPSIAAADIPLVAPDARAFAELLHPSGSKIGWLACYGFIAGERDPRTVTLHYAAAMHGDPDLPARLDRELATRGLASYRTACAALETPRLHFITYAQGAAPKITAYFVPEVA